MQPPLFAPVSLSVSDVTRYLRELIEADEILQDVWVQGEISNFARPGSGHIYFTLKDQTSALKCVIWKTTALRLRVALQSGLAIEAHGQIGIYERDGQYQLYVDAVRLAGEGALYQEFLRLKARLEAEGLFDEERKKTLPERPKRIGIVTSATGAVLQDMLNTLQARFPLVEVLLAHAAVQGVESPPQVVAALRALNQVDDVDVIIVARGGGSLEDLWCFNDERVVREIAASVVPVVTGIGHETDFTLADFAADVRAPTPTGAAVAATPDADEDRQLLADLERFFLNTAQQNIELRRDAVDALAQRIWRTSPLRQIQNDRQRLDELSDRLQRAWTLGMTLRHMRLQALQAQLSSLNPQAVLQRGYALLRKADGSLVHRAGQVIPGEQLNAELAEGTLAVEVRDIIQGRGIE